MSGPLAPVLQVAGEPGRDHEGEALADLRVVERRRVRLLHRMTERLEQARRIPRRGHAVAVNREGIAWRARHQADAEPAGTCPYLGGEWSGGG